MPLGYVFLGVYLKKLCPATFPPGTVTFLEVGGHWHCFRSSTVSDLMSLLFFTHGSFTLFFPPSFNQSGCWDPSHYICVLVWKKVESEKGMVCLIDCPYPSLRLQLCPMMMSTEREVDRVSSYLGTLPPYTKWRFCSQRKRSDWPLGRHIIPHSKLDKLENILPLWEKQE